MDCLSGMLDHVNHLEREFHHLFTEVGREASPKAIHNLRLNLKRQKALFRLLEALDDTFSASLAEEAYGKLYKRLGKLRDLQVQMNVIREDEELLKLETSFSDWLQQQEKEKREHIRQYESSFSMVPVRRLFSLLRNRLSFVPAEEWKPRLDRYFTTRIEALRGYGIAAPGRERHFHECRRLVKELAYNFELAQTLCDEEPEDRHSLDWLHDLQQRLGAWHDRYFCLRHLKDQAYECPAAIPAQLSTEKQVLAEQIEDALDNMEPSLDALRQAWKDLLARQEEPPAPAPRPAKPNGNVRTAFGQMNIAEGSK